MVAGDFLQDPQVRQWLDGVEPAWTLLTFERPVAQIELRQGARVILKSHEGE
jgi:hypothetical protein